MEKEKCMSLVVEFTDEEVKTIDNSLMIAYAEVDTKYFAFAVKILQDSLDRARKANENAININNLFIDKEVVSARFDDAKPLFLDHFFYKGESIVLASKAGIGKSWLSIEIAKNSNIKKPLFFTLEDYNERQIPRYLNSLNELKEGNLEIIGYKNWTKMFNSILTSMKEKLNFKAIQETVTKLYSAQYYEISRRRDQLEKQHGIKKELGLDNILVFEQFMEILKDSDFDFICIDSLNALLGNPNRITRRVLERIISKTTEQGKTLLLIHHINKKGDIAGSSDLINTVDSAYILMEEVKKGPNDDEDNDKTFVLEEIKARYKRGKRESVKIKMEDDPLPHIVHFSLVDEVQPGVVSKNEWFYDLNESEQLIVSAFIDQEKNELTKEEIKYYLADAENGIASLEKLLKGLEKTGVLQANGPQKAKERWDKITLLKDYDDEFHIERQEENK
ncbi:MAG: AAA family ATPase [Prevotella sp.]|nr:AAA family ATPase [Prevotella sp.]